MYPNFIFYNHHFKSKKHIFCHKVCKPPISHRYDPTFLQFSQYLYLRKMHYISGKEWYKSMFWGSKLQEKSSSFSLGPWKNCASKAKRSCGSILNPDFTFFDNLVEVFWCCMAQETSKSIFWVCIRKLMRFGTEPRPPKYSPIHTFLSAKLNVHEKRKKWNFTIFGKNGSCGLL